MTPQFVDYDADGHIDILAATFDGSPHVALGSADGFRAPEHVLDSAGERVMLSQFWNYETEEWDDSGSLPNAHCTSALAFDWDDDGDLDLLMGDYGKGTLFLRENEGEPGAPAFDGPNLPVEVDGEAFELEGGLASMQLVDWDGDGLEDLLCGGYGDPYANKLGGGIVWCKNVGERGEPRFARQEVLIERSKKGTRTPVRPDSGLHVQAVDWNGDGRLDLLVGGYTHWSPPKRALSPEEEARASELETTIDELGNAMNELYAEAFAGMEEMTKDERKSASEALVESAEYQTLVDERRKATAELGELRPEDKREGSVWVYLREE